MRGTRPGLHSGPHQAKGQGCPQKRDKAGWTQRNLGEAMNIAEEERVTEGGTHTGQAHGNDPPLQSSLSLTNSLS